MVLGRTALLAFMAHPGAILLASYGLNSDVHAYDHDRPGEGGTVRFDTFQRLLDDGMLVELPQYDKQPLSIHRYRLAAEPRP